MYQGDVIRYNLSAYGVDEDIILKILDIKPCKERIVVTPIAGEWIEPFRTYGWKETETVSADYIIEYLYTITPSTPPIYDDGE
jgi:hypothetical protein